MPLLNASPLSSIGTAYLSSDATSGGSWCWVEWTDWWRMKKLHTVEAALDTTPVSYTVGQGAKGPITLEIPSCPAALWTALAAIQTASPRVTTVLKHAQLGTKTYDTKVLSLIAGGDEQWETGDPVEKVVVRLYSFGAL